MTRPQPSTTYSNTTSTYKSTARRESTTSSLHALLRQGRRSTRSNNTNDVFSSSSRNAAMTDLHQAIDSFWHEIDTVQREREQSRRNEEDLDLILDEFIDTNTSESSSDEWFLGQGPAPQ